MITITLLVYVILVMVTANLAFGMGLADDEQFWAVLGGVALLAFTIGCAIYWDLYGRPYPPPDESYTGWLLLIGLVGIALVSIAHWIFAGERMRGPALSGRGGVSTLVSIISYVSSVLGIVSFYLRHLRPFTE